MIGDHVPQCARGLVEPSALFGANGLSHRDLHVIDVIAVPDRLEEAVPEPKGHDVLDRFLPEEMVDAIDLVLGQYRENGAIEGSRALEIAPERLLDDYAPPSPVLLPGKARYSQPINDRPEQVRFDGKIKQHVARSAAVTGNALA